MTTFISFFKYEVTQSSVTIKEGSVDFPAVTLCNLAPFDFVLNRDLLTSYIQDYYPSLDIKLKRGTSALDEVNKMLKHMRAKVFSKKLKDNLNDTFIESLGFRKTLLVFSCFYGTAPCDLNKDFTWFHDYNYGNCYTFNKNK